MENSVSKKELFSSAGWKFGERIIAQGISFVISIILARILLPEQYGTISLVLVFVSIANVFVTSGLGESLIQKKESNSRDFSTIFFCSLALSLFLYFVLFFAAPLISSFFNETSLTPVIRVLSLQIPFSSVKTIQHAYVSKHMLFKKFFYSTLIGTVVSGCVGIFMALKGFGVWSLVAQYLINSLMDMLVLFLTVKWRPTLTFSFVSAKKYISYGSKLMLAQLINTVYGESKNLIIGKVFSKQDLANSNKGSQFPSLIIENVNSSISAVLFPAMSRVNDDAKALKRLTKQSLIMSCYIIFPMMVGMAAISSSLVNFLLTEKWSGCVPFLQMACAFWMFQPSLTANYQALKATGRSDLCLKLEIIKKIIGILLIISAMFINVYAIALSSVIVAFISMIINIFPNRKLINYGYKEQLKDVSPSLFLSLFMGLIIYPISFLPLSPFIIVLIQFLLGTTIYLLGSYIFKFSSLFVLIDYIKSFKKTRR